MMLMQYLRVCLLTGLCSLTKLFPADEALRSCNTHKTVRVSDVFSADWIRTVACGSFQATKNVCQRKDCGFD